MGQPVQKFGMSNGNSTLVDKTKILFKRTIELLESKVNNYVVFLGQKSQKRSQCAIRVVQPYFDTFNFLFTFRIL